MSIYSSIFLSIQSFNPLIYLTFSLVSFFYIRRKLLIKNMAYRAFLNPNKPCFLILLYLHFKMNLHNDRTLFDGDIDTGTRGKKQGNKDTIIYKFIADFRLSFIYIDFYTSILFLPVLFEFYHTQLILRLNISILQHHQVFHHIFL